MNALRTLVLTIACACAAVSLQAQTNFRAISYDQALKVAAQENKQVFIDFYTDWCGPCKKMAASTFPDKAVGDYMNPRYVCIQINAEKEGVDLAKKFGVKAYPSFFIVDTKGNIVFPMVGYMEPDAFLAKIKGAADPAMTPKGIADRYLSGERTPEIVNSYALQKMEAGAESEGFDIVHAYFRSLSNKQKLKAENAFLFLRYTISLDDEMAKFMLDNLDKFEPSVRDSIKERTQRLFHAQLASYFSGYRRQSGKYKQEEYDSLKAQISSLGLDKTYAYEPMFKLIEGRMKMNDDEFLALCKQEFNNLDQVDKDLLVVNVSRLIDNDTPAMKAAWAAFIRENLPKLGSTAIGIVGRILASLEPGQ